MDRRVQPENRGNYSGMTKIDSKCAACMRRMKVREVMEVESKVGSEQDCLKLSISFSSTCPGDDFLPSQA